MEILSVLGLPEEKACRHLGLPWEVGYPGAFVFLTLAVLPKSEGSLGVGIPSIK